MNNKKFIPPYIQRGIIALAILLGCISLGRMQVRIHQQQEKIEQLEEGLLALNERIDRLQNSLLPSHQFETRNLQAEKKQAYHSRQNRSTIQDKDYARSGTDALSHIPTENADREKASDSLRPKPLSIQVDESKSHKYTEPHLFNLNHIDSLTLIRIPGIAAKTASTILRYRQQYGGFYDPWQLQDFLTWDAAQAYMDEWCTKWFTADVSNVKLIPINRATVAELRRHPYISYNQAIDIVNYRTRHKRIEKIEEINNLSTFKPEEVKRVSFYLSFE